jgi:hypothetical protein
MVLQGLGGVAGLGAEIAAVDLPVVLPGFRDGRRTVGEVAEVNAVLGQRQECAVLLVDFVVAVGLSVLVDVVAGHFLWSGIGQLAPLLRTGLSCSDARPRVISAEGWIG